LVAVPELCAVAGSLEPVVLAAVPEDAGILFLPMVLRSSFFEPLGLEPDDNGDLEARRKTSKGAGEI
jgi:hypothetical protein